MSPVLKSILVVPHPHILKVSVQKERSPDTRYHETFVQFTLFSYSSEVFFFFSRVFLSDGICIASFYTKHTIRLAVMCGCL